MNKKVANKLIKSSYVEFSSIIDMVGNKTDSFVEADDIINGDLEIAAKKKRKIDAVIKGLKESKKNLRICMTAYMQKNDIERMEGVKSKSISFQPATNEDEDILVKQIFVGRKYEDLDKFSKDDLVKMLKKFGVRTKSRCEITNVSTPANIRVMR